MQQTTSALICSIFYMLSRFRYAFSVFNLLFSVSPLIFTQYSLHILLHIFSYVNRLNCARYKIISFFLVTLNLFFFLMYYFYVRFTCLVAMCCLFVYVCNFERRLQFIESPKTRQVQGTLLQCIERRGKMTCGCACAGISKIICNLQTR